MGITYYYNKQLGVSQFEMPNMESPPLPPPPSSSMHAAQERRVAPKFSEKKKRSATDEAELMMLQEERARLRPLIHTLSGKEKGAALGDLAVVELNIARLS